MVDNISMYIGYNNINVCRLYRIVIRRTYIIGAYVYYIFILRLRYNVDSMKKHIVYNNWHVEPGV